MMGLLSCNEQERKKFLPQKRPEALKRGGGSWLNVEVSCYGRETQGPSTPQDRFENDPAPLGMTLWEKLPLG